ncbi:MAG: AbrB/MazE/SpoVT family DNA-binding domain-containing protein [Peptostreptococcaceae bacterium]
MKVDRNIMINKAGGNSGKNTVNYRVSLPADMVKALGITPEDKSVILTLEDEKIIIEKKVE